MINCCGAISKGAVKEGRCEEISSKKIAEWVLKESAIIEPEKNITARGNSIEQWNKHTTLIRGTESRLMWQKCSLTDTVLRHIFSHLFLYETGSIIIPYFIAKETTA